MDEIFPDEESPTIGVCDIENDVCKRCGKCCWIRIELQSTDSRFRKFLRGVGVRILPETEEGEEDCCEEVHPVRIDLGRCIHLHERKADTEIVFECDIYESRPQLCRDFNCVAWALVNDTYSVENDLLMAAERARKQSEMYGQV